MKRTLSIWGLLLGGFHAAAQLPDTAETLKEVIIKGYRTIHGTGHLLDTEDGVIYAGKKTEVILVDSLNANRAINNTREILGRIPGLNIVESESSGFTANGIATRGLNPAQSVEMNTRQNGYNISGDVYGYNEAYYLPPMEAVKRIELVRGAASLQFGSQFGGLVNYLIKDAPSDRPFQFRTSQTGGSFGLFNSFNSVGGTFKRWSYYGFLQYRTLEGYRPNSGQWQRSGFGRLQYAASDRLDLSLEYSMLRNRLQMPGGLTDSIFAVDPKASLRARNWLKSPWNIVNTTLRWRPGNRTTLSVQNTFLFSNRSLVWRNEDGGPGALDLIDPATGQFVPREVESEDMRSLATEMRLTRGWTCGGKQQTLAAGFRISRAGFHRQEGGPGTTGSDFDLSIDGPWESDLRFSTTNIAPFAENIFRVGKRLTFTPGVRWELLKSTASGYVEESGSPVTANKTRLRHFLLGGFGMEYKPKEATCWYANISQAYRPVDYSQQQPFGVAAKIDDHLKDPWGFNSDLGYRTMVGGYLNIDVSGFFLACKRAIGTVLKTDNVTGEAYAFRTNVASSVHKGLEAYEEFDLLKFLDRHARHSLALFNSFSWTDARYTTGPFRGNRVEAAPQVIERAGVTFCGKRLSVTWGISYTGDSFGDASNAEVSDTPIAGYIPSYTVMDLSTTWRAGNYAIRLGVNNLADRSYFTQRTDEYPGPGIIPAVGRSFYLGFCGTF